jgi:hypothetical protein
MINLINMNNKGHKLVAILEEDKKYCKNMQILNRSNKKISDYLKKIK